MRCLLLPLAVLVSCMWEGCYARDLSPSRELGESSLQFSGSGYDFQAKEGTALEVPAESNIGTDKGPRSCTCGIRNTATRIVGGNPTTKHEYPWQAALVVRTRNRPFCGASIISNQWILTAAHCVKRWTVMGAAVVIGEHNYATSTETSVTQRKLIAKAISHPQYNSRTLDNDIALLKLTEPISFQSDNKIAPVCLPTPGNLYEAVEATVTGWGRLQYGGSQPLELQEVTVPTMTNAECKATGYRDYKITNNMICAGVPQGGKDSCQGDSGGPMVTGSGSMQQIGIVSWGKGCALKNYPGIYTRVGNYLEWIQTTVTGSETCPPAA